MYNKDAQSHPREEEKGADVTRDTEHFRTVLQTNS